MATRMSHPKHGITIAVGAEVEWNKQNGWVESPGVKKPEPVAPPVEAVQTVAETETLSTDARTQYIAKFGRPPHHRMNEATILRELSEE